ncbi:hypothetical protein [Salaquimonas pukyongi]|uniref:hypothetical protein n=1 Tax=Salaquimonas pukyongi TaxID=2712698 RepID=UPI00096B9D3B|nr:hypothetical protein [Salaquimonas pukyongi]
MEHIKAFIKAVGGKWFMLPSALAGIITVYNFVSPSIGWPEMSWWVVIPIALGLIITWAVVGLIITVVKQERTIRESWEFFDRSGRHLISVKDAIELIIERLSGQWSPDLDIDAKRSKAAAKLREIGFEGQIPIWGYEIIELPDRFQDFRKQIPSRFWGDNYIKLDYVYIADSSEDAPVIHTHEAEEANLNRQEQRIYGDLRINRKALELLCPPEDI